LSKDTTAGF